MFQFIQCLPDHAKYGAADSESPEEGGGGEDVLHMEPGAGEGEGGERHQPGHHRGALQHAAPPAMAYQNPYIEFSENCDELCTTHCTTHFTSHCITHCTTHFTTHCTAHSTAHSTTHCTMYCTTHFNTHCTTHCINHCDAH